MKHDYSQLSADEVTQILGNSFLRQLEIIKDKKKGFLRTSFGIFSIIITQDLAKLRDAVLEKNGIEKINAENVCYDYLPDIITAVEARGSKAAEGIKEYHIFTNVCEKQARETAGFNDMSSLQKTKLRLRVAKNNQPS